MHRDLVCFSHLRWDFVYQRPNHLMARAARDRRVFFVEEPLVESLPRPTIRTARREGVCVVTPVLPERLDAPATEAAMAGLLDSLLAAEGVRDPVVWYYTPMALPWTRRVAASASAVVYDSMDYLAGFRGAPPRLLELEEELLARADLVFTGGASLHGRMVGRHGRAHCFPSSIDLGHFRSARRADGDPPDQAAIPHPRIGYAGVIDERIDLELVDRLAAARPDWSVVLLGPIAKIDEADVPSRPNIHRLGMKRYAELPAYLAGWDVGWMPFARNEATRYISPTKTPEYLAAGLPVVSTAIHDVVEPYGRLGLVEIASTVDGAVHAVERILGGAVPDPATVDTFLSRGSWDRAWATMAELIEDVVRERTRRRAPTRSRAAARVRGMGPERVPLAASSAAGSPGLERVPAPAAARATAD